MDSDLHGVEDSFNTNDNTDQSNVQEHVSDGDYEVQEESSSFVGQEDAGDVLGDEVDAIQYDDVEESAHWENSGYEGEEEEEAVDEKDAVEEHEDGGELIYEEEQSDQYEEQEEDIQFVENEQDVEINSREPFESEEHDTGLTEEVADEAGEEELRRDVVVEDDDEYDATGGVVEEIGEEDEVVEENDADVGGFEQEVAEEEHFRGVVDETTEIENDENISGALGGTEDQDVQGSNYEEVNYEEEHDLDDSGELHNDEHVVEQHPGDDVYAVEEYNDEVTEEVAESVGGLLPETIDHGEDQHDDVDGTLHQSEEITETVDQADENLGEVEQRDVGNEDDDYEDVVEVEEEKMNEDEEDENVAQHELESENEQDEEVNDHVKLGHVSDDDLRDSDDENDEVEMMDADKKDETTDQQNEAPSQAAIAKMFDSESEDEGEKGGVGDLIADIFGESDDEDEEFTGFGEEEANKSAKNKTLAAVISDSDEEIDEEVGKPVEEQQDESSDEGVSDNRGVVSSGLSDFDLMMQRKKEERKGRRKRDGGTSISDADDIINAMLTKMREAADADREANRMKKPALNKLKMLPTVVRHLKKQDLKEAFVDMGMIAAAADWLSLLPDRSLPHISIRSELLQILHDLPSVSSETLKTSGIGRAVMMLFKHPRETRKHKESAGRLINKWSRPIFGLNDNFKSMSRGEREQRDLEQMPQSKRRRLSSGRNEAEKQAGDQTHEPGQLRPGERGFVMRARVPMPSNKDYVIRPKWNIETNEDESPSSFNKRSKQRKDERLEKHLKTFADRRKNSKMQRAVGISIEGNKMPLS